VGPNFQNFYRRAPPCDDEAAAGRNCQKAACYTMCYTKINLGLTFQNFYPRAPPCDDEAAAGRNSQKLYCYTIS